MYLPQCVGQYGDSERTTVVSVMFGGCISYYGVGTLSPIDGTMNSEKYVNVVVHIGI